MWQRGGGNRTDWIQDVEAVKQIRRQSIGIVQTLLDTRCGRAKAVISKTGGRERGDMMRLGNGGAPVVVSSNQNIRGHIPISASLTPRSAPFSPFPRNGSMTPGLSYEYTSGSCDSLRRVESTRVIPGCADVRSAFGVAARGGPSQWCNGEQGSGIGHLRPGMPVARSAFSSVDLPTLGIPTTRTFSSGACGLPFAMSIKYVDYSRRRPGERKKAGDTATDQQAFC